MFRDVNRNPRRWVDASGRVRVIEGSHPSEPERVGYNLVVDGDWFGTFETLDAAIIAATAEANVEIGRVELRSIAGPRGRAGSLVRGGLRLVPEPPDDA
jgi:hypothetical protein